MSDDGKIFLNQTCLDLRAGTLMRGTELIALRSRSFLLLSHMARAPGKVFSKAELLDAVWPDVLVTEDSLTQAIHDIRVALSDPGGACLRTFRGRGYALNPDRPAPRSPAAPAAAPPATAAQGRTMRVAVLPFADAALPAEMRPLILALSDEIAGGLSRFRTLSILARGSAEAAASETTDPQAIAARLRAHYLVQGTAHLSETGLMLRLSLIDGAEGTLVWSDGFDCSGTRLLGVNADITQRLVAHLNTGLEEEIDSHSAQQRTESLTAFGHFARGRSALCTFEPAAIADAHVHLTEAVKADPGFADAWALLAWAEFAMHDYRMAPPAVYERAQAHARRAVDLAPNSSLAMGMLGYVQTLHAEYAQAEANIDIALRLNPSNVDAMMDRALLLIARGRHHEALHQLDRAQDINPLRFQHFARAFRAEAHYLLGQYEQAVAELSALSPLQPRRALWLAAALAKSGRPAEAAPHLAAFTTAYPDEDPIAAARHSYNYEHAADTEHLLDGLRLAIGASEGALT